MSATKTAHFGLVGYGAWGRQHAQTIAVLPGLTLAAIACAGDESAQAARAAYPSTRVTRDWREVIADPSLDIIDIATPNFMHAEVAVAALRAGKDVLVEKPMATSAADCDAILAAERETGRLVSVGHELRQSAQWGKVKSLIDEDAIGEPLFLNINLFRNFYRSGASGWRYDKGRVGSWLLEEMVHHFDLALWYFARHGDPVTLRAHGNQRSGRDPGLFDNVSILIRYANGAYVTISQCVAGFEHSLVLEIAGTDGAIRTHWSGTMDRDHNAEFDLRVQPKGFPFERGVRECERIRIAQSGEVFELTEQIRLTVAGFAERRALVPAGEARKRVLLCLAAEQSLMENREVELALG
ncbi:MAG: Gfo/Idh/MocA family oxidoreductase [Casimicrobiaceae bacterium]